MAACSCSVRSITAWACPARWPPVSTTRATPASSIHSLSQLLAQRLCGLALGYEDLNDHAFLRRDPLLATACDKLDPLGLDRCHPAFRGAALAAPSPLNRLELSNHKSTRCHQLAHEPAAIAQGLLSLGARCLPKHARAVVLDLAAMGHLVHGAQEGRHFSAYDDGYG